MAKKKRINLRLDDNEIAVVGSLQQWEHLILIYEAFAADAKGQEKNEWLGCASWIREWIEHAKGKEIEEEW